MTSHAAGEERPARRAPWAPLVPAAVLVIHASLMYRAALGHTGGSVSYPVDDTFIHLALAKRIAFDGVYGVTAHEFAAASSSVGWPLLLASAMALFGAKAWLPLLLNGLLAVLLLFAVDRAVRSIASAASVIARIAVGLTVVVLTPLPTLVILGMEHTAHALATIAFLTEAGRWLVEARRPSPRETLRLLAWAALVTTFRYEGAFPVALVVGGLLLRRRFRHAAAVALAGATPITAFGAYSLAHGGMFLPNPVALKGKKLAIKQLADIGDLLGGDLMDRLGGEGQVLAIAVLLAGVAWLVARRDGLRSRGCVTLLLSLAMTILHVQFASIGWFYRYESYLVATGLALAGAGIAELAPYPRDVLRLAREEPAKVAPAVLAVVLLSAPLWKRALGANANTAQACRNIHEQQVQSGRFLARHFGSTPVAVNDIGAVAWLGEEPIVDLVGLATLPVAKAKGLKLDRPMPLADLERLTAGVEVAIVYDEWFREGLPARWVRVGRWRIEDNKSCAFPTVSIYATAPDRIPRVIEALRAFDPSLPKDVARLGRYVERAGDDRRVRDGDHVVVDADASELSGSYVVDEDGTVLLPKVGPVLVRGASEDELRARLVAGVRERGAPDVREAAIARASFVPTHPAEVQVVGRVAKSVSVRGRLPDLDDALRAVLPLPPADPSRVFVWRERGDGSFARLGRDELGTGALEDGDIVVVP